MTNSSSKNWDV